MSLALESPLLYNCAYFNSYQEKKSTVCVNRADVNAAEPHCKKLVSLYVNGLPVVSVNDSMVRSFPSLGIFQFGVCLVLQEKSHNSNVTLTGCSHQ